MVLETVILIIAVIVIAAFSLAISLKIYGENRWLLGSAMLLVSAFILMISGLLFVAWDDDANRQEISTLAVLVFGALATLGTTFKRFRQLGRQGHKTLESDPLSFTIDTHSMEEFDGNTTADSQEVN